jgi:SAM-dependent methyltransferase
MSLPDFDPRRFRANVPYYARFRLPYPDLLVDRIAEWAGLETGDAVLDLGAGPGPLAIAFARMGMEVTAIDPEPDMLAALRLAAAEAETEIDIRLGSSFEMPGDIGTFRLVTMGRAFHWMDRAATLEMLDGFVTRDGAVALIHDDHPPTAENAWRSLLRDLANRYGRADAAHVRAAKAPDYRAHESLLLASVFNRIERIGVIIRREIGADDIVGLAYSLSALSPERLGARARGFETELRGELARLSPDGRFIEIAELSALVARRA